jgi:hypothetical protein
VGSQGYVGGFVLSGSWVCFVFFFFGSLFGSLCICLVYLEALCAVRVCVGALLLCNFCALWVFWYKFHYLSKKQKNVGKMKK